MDILYEFHPFVFGGSTEKGRFCAALPLKTPPSSLLSTHGRLFGLFYLRYPDVFPLEDTAREILPYFERLYYERECRSPHSHLVASLTETQSFLEKRILDVNGVDSVEFSLLVGCVWGSVLYVARCGGMCALRIYRDDSFGILFDTASSSGSSGVVSLSGYVQPHDVVLLYDAAVQTSQFPLSSSSLESLDKQVVYSKLTQLFDVVSQEKKGQSVSGFYIDSAYVPSVENERIVFAQVDEDKRGEAAVHLSSENELSEEASDLEAAVEEETPPRVFQEVVDSPASVRSFGLRIKSHISFPQGGFFSRFRFFLAFFNRGRIFFIGSAFLILFVGFILIGKDYENTFKQEKKIDTLKQELIPKIEEAYKQGQYYAELNPDRAKTYLKEAQGYIAQFGDEAKTDVDIARLTDSVREAYSIVTKTYLLDSLLPFFDLSTLNQQASGNKAAIDVSRLVISDAGQNTVYSVDFTSRAASAIIGREDVTGLVSAEGDAGIVYAVSAGGIVRTERNSSKIVKLLDAPTDWGRIADMQVFGSSVYLLDTSRNQIWKYIPEGNSFGPVRNYVSSEEDVRLESAVSLSIDGNVWVGLSDGNVIKFYSGKKDQFSLANLEQPLASLHAIYTDENTDYLFVLDSTVGRVVVFSKKDGSYISTYQSPQFVGAGDFVVDSKGNQLFVLHKNSIYRVELREQSKAKE